jgi:hypothetical protein
LGLWETSGSGCIYVHLKLYIYTQNSVSYCFKYVGSKYDMYDVHMICI